MVQKHQEDLQEWQLQGQKKLGGSGKLCWHYGRDQHNNLACVVVAPITSAGVVFSTMLVGSHSRPLFGWLAVCKHLLWREQLYKL